MTMTAHKPPIGTVVRDTELGRTGRVMGHEGPYVQLRPVDGGREWDARPSAVRLATLDERLQAGVESANARARGERL